MKKVLMMLAVVAGCVAMTSCKSDAEKVAQLRYDAEHAESPEEAQACVAEAVKIAADNIGNPDFDKECKDAYKKLKEAKEGE